MRIFTQMFNKKALETFWLILCSVFWWRQKGCLVVIRKLDLSGFCMQFQNQTIISHNHTKTGHFGQHLGFYHSKTQSSNCLFLMFQFLNGWILDPHCIQRHEVNDGKRNDSLEVQSPPPHSGNYYRFSCKTAENLNIRFFYDFKLLFG